MLNLRPRADATRRGSVGGACPHAGRREHEYRCNRYWVAGSESLNYKSYSVESDDSGLVRNAEIYAAVNRR